MANSIAIYGAGGFGREVLMLIRHINHAFPDTWQPIGFFDDNLPPGARIHNLPVLGGLADLNQYQDSLALAMGIGWPLIRKKLVSAITNPLIYFPSLIDPDVRLHPEQQNSIGQGCIICQGSKVTVDSVLGNHVLLNLNCTVGHDSRLGDFCSLMPAVNIGGAVIMEDYVFAGTGAVVNNQVTVGRYAVIGAGAVVTRTVSTHTTVKGVPAR